MTTQQESRQAAEDSEIAQLKAIGKTAHQRRNRPVPTESDIPMHGWGPYDEIHRERIRAHAKHGAAGHSSEQLPASHREWPVILMEELGEVAHELTYDTPDGYANLRKELIQVAAMACAWIDAIDAEARP